jgi:hypothetical protein
LQTSFCNGDYYYGFVSSSRVLEGAPRKPRLSHFATEEAIFLGLQHSSHSGLHGMVTQHAFLSRARSFRSVNAVISLTEVIPPASLSDSTLVKLSCVDCDAQGVSFLVIGW